jgi:enoyl-CoA hydratase
LSKPVIAMIQGYCLGGGLALAIRADIRIASEDSIFGIPAAKLGFSYSQAGVNNLIDIIGRSAAGEMLLTAKHYTAQDALRMGLVNTVVPVQELKPEVEKLAQILAGNSPLSMRATKYMINARTQSRHHYSEEAEQLLRRCFASQDYIEGRKAFKEKRKPVFRGE